VVRVFSTKHLVAAPVVPLLRAPAAGVLVVG
jgi:hypothetical protein